MAFDPSMKRFYDDNGYLVVERLVSPDDLVAVRQRVDQIVADPSRAPAGVEVGRESDTRSDKSALRGSGNDPLRKLGGMGRFDPAFQRLATNPRLLSVVRGLIGPRVKLFRDQMLLKPPGGQDKPTHQDQSYFRLEPADALVTAWIALDDATLENGCMRYVPRSHRHGLFEMELDPERPIHHVPRTSHLNLPPEATCPVSAGSVILHHGFTLHRSGVNNTNTWRRAVIFHYATSNARSQTQSLNEEVSLEID
jgi:ectoine hydroxylase-related dioxygenase (phytanoyl-CoA dioxygenase family)